MWPVSARWLDAVRHSRDVIVTAEVWKAGTYTGTNLSPAGGNVRVDESSKVRRAGALTVADVTLMPDTADDFLSPVDTDVLVKVGHRYTEGDVESVPVLMGRIETIERGSLGGPIQLTLSDYSAVLARARFVWPWATPANSRVVDEIARMVHDVLPWVPVFNLVGSTALTTAATWERQRWDAITTLATSIAAEAVFDPLGRLLLRPIADGTEPSVWTMDTDTETAIVEDAKVALDMAGVYNGVVVSSSDRDTPPVSAFVWQNAGPLRWQDGFKVTRFFSSPVLRTYQACYAAAATVLAKSLIYAAQIEPTIVPDPALDAGDTGTVLLPDGVPATRVLAGFTIPLDPAGQRMTCTLRTGLTDVVGSDQLQEAS